MFRSELPHKLKNPSSYQVHSLAITYFFVIMCVSIHKIKQSVSTFQMIIFWPFFRIKIMVIQIRSVKILPNSVGNILCSLLFVVLIKLLWTFKVTTHINFLLIYLTNDFPNCCSDVCIAFLLWLGVHNIIHWALYVELYEVARETLNYCSSKFSIVKNLFLHLLEAHFTNFLKILVFFNLFQQITPTIYHA